MIVHWLVPAPDGKASNRLKIETADVVVVGDGDAEFDFIAPSQGGVERQQRRSYTVLAIPCNGVAGRQLNAVVQMLHINLKTVGAVV